MGRSMPSTWTSELIWVLKYYEHADTVVQSNHMMFPMAGLVSARVWAGLSEEDRALIGDLMAQHVDSTIDTYVEKSKMWLDQIKDTGRTYKIVDASFFSDAISSWNEIWHSAQRCLLTCATLPLRLRKSNATRSIRRGCGNVPAIIMRRPT